MKNRFLELIRRIVAGWKPRASGTKLYWRLSVPAAAIVVAVVALALRPSQTTAKVGNETLQALPVPVAKVDREDLFKELTVQAEFRPFQEIDLHSKVAGFLQQISVDIGDRVKEGDLLATLEIPELEDDLTHARAVEKRSEDEVTRAGAAHEETHLAYTRLAAVQKARPNLVAQQDLDATQARDRASESALDAAGEQVQIAKSDVEKLQTMLKYSRITAPFSGVITRRYADRGALIQAGTAGGQTLPLVRLSENDRLRLVFPVSVSFVRNINVGDPVEIRNDSSGQTLRGVISRFARKVDTDTRTMETEVDVPNPDLKLIPGMYVSVRLKVDRRPNALAVPVEAISGGKSPTVYLINQKGEIEEHPVTLGIETSTKVEVMAGLRENDLVMIGSHTQVKPGQKVEPKFVEPLITQ
jgi:RND family efflux transporter MFP subunit